MNKTFLALAAVGIAALAGHAVAQRNDGKAARRLTIEQLVDIRHPSNPMWSPDGRSAVFVWDRAGVSNVYVAAADARGQAAAPRQLPAAGASLNGAFWSTDGRALLVPRDGDLWRV